MTAIAVASMVALKSAKGKWISTPTAALMMRRWITSARDWDTWLKEDRRERYKDQSNIACYKVADRVLYDSADVQQLIEEINSGHIDLKHRIGRNYYTEPVIERIKSADGTRRVKITTNGRTMAAPELRELIFKLAKQYKLLMRHTGHAVF